MAVKGEKRFGQQVSLSFPSFALNIHAPPNFLGLAQQDSDLKNEEQQQQTEPLGLDHFSLHKTAIARKINLITLLPL